MLLPNWSEFTLFHEDNLHLQQECAKIINAFSDSDTNAKKLANLASIQTTPSTVILTLDAFDNQVKSSFFHQTTGPTFIDNSPIKCIALTGFETTATAIHLNVNHLQETLTANTINTPSLVALMSTSTTTLDSLKELVPEPNTIRPVRKAAILPPLLIESLIKLEDPNAWEILHAFIKTIHDTIPEDTEEDDLSLANPYFPILTTLWAFSKHDTITNLHTARSPATDTSAITWSKNIHDTYLLQLPKNPPQHQNSLAIDRLADSLAARDARFAIAIEDEPSDPNDLTKRWKKIDMTMRQAVLFASTPDGLTVPDLPSDRLLQLVQAKNGAIAARLLKRWHPRLDILVQAGMASNISNCTFASQPDEFAIDTFSPFFTPPLRAGFQNISNDELNSLALSSTSFNLLPTDIKKLTSCTPYVATTPTLYKQQLKNFHAVLSDVFTPDSLLAQIIQKAITHYENNEMHYHTIVNNDKFFIVWMLNRVHFKTQSILHQCLMADTIDDIQFNVYALDDELNNIRTFNFHTIAPKWYLDELDRQHDRDRTRLPSKHENASNGRYRERSHSNTRDKARSRLDNNNIDSFVQLQSGEKYHWLTHFTNLKKCSHLSVKLNGDYVCNNWHIRGHCTSNCRRRDTHINLPSEQKANLRKYVTGLRKVRDEYNATQSRSRTNMTENQGEQKSAD